MAGCASAPAAPADNTGRELAVIQLSATHSVRFLQLDSGDVVTLEQGRVEDAPLDFDAIGAEPATAYRGLAARVGLDPTIPEALSEALAELAARPAQPLPSERPPSAAGNNLGTAHEGLSTSTGTFPASFGSLWQSPRCLAGRWDISSCPAAASSASFNPNTLTMNFDAACLNVASSGNASFLVKHGSLFPTTDLQVSMAPGVWYRLLDTANSSFHTSSCSGTQVLQASGARWAMPSLQPLWDNPANQSDATTDNMEGVAHDGIYWWFTATSGHCGGSGCSDAGRIWSVPIAGTPTPSAQVFAWQGTWNHFGDLTLIPGNSPSEWPGYLLVGLESAGGTGDRGAIGVFDIHSQLGTARALAYANFPKDDCSTTPCDALQLRNGNRTDGPDSAGFAPWVAVNPTDGVVYSSNFNAATLYRYNLNKTTWTLTTLPPVPLILPAGAQQPFLRRVQGGKFTQNGKLYLAVDSQQADPSLAGVVMVETQTGIVQGHAGVGGVTAGDELEGIDAFDLDATPGAQLFDNGQLHVILLHNGGLQHNGSPDSFDFTHFRANVPSHL